MARKIVVSEGDLGRLQLSLAEAAGKLSLKVGVDEVEVISSLKMTMVLCGELETLILNRMDFFYEGKLILTNFDL